VRGCVACMWPWCSGLRPCPTLSVPATVTPTSVVSLLGGIVKEPRYTPSLSSNSPGENPDLAFGTGSDTDNIVDVATFLEALFLEMGPMVGTRADDTCNGYICGTLCAPMSCEHSFFGWHGQGTAEDLVLRHLGLMEALDRFRLMFVDTCCDGNGVRHYSMVRHSGHRWRFAV
jgi:hypothetical protein